MLFTAFLLVLWLALRVLPVFFGVVGCDFRADCEPRSDFLRESSVVSADPSVRGFFTDADRVTFADEGRLDAGFFVDADRRSSALFFGVDAPLITYTKNIYKRNELKPKELYNYLFYNSRF